MAERMRIPKVTARCHPLTARIFQTLGQESALHSGTTVSIDIEPFADFGQYATDTAYPHADSLFPVSRSLHFFVAAEPPGRRELEVEILMSALGHA